MLSMIMKEHVKGRGKDRRLTKQPGGQTNQHKEKKPFDKKKYRLQKYSNKFKVNQWEERKKKVALRGLYKELHKKQGGEKHKLSDEDNSDHGETSSQVMKRPSALYKAKQEFLQQKNEKQRRHEEIEKSKAEKEEALKKYKQKKMQAYVKLSKKTKKGQPVMKDRLEMLLEKIQASVK